MDIATELEAIRRLKYAYFRTLDLKQFDQLALLLTEDATAAYADGKTTLTGRDVHRDLADRGAGRPGASSTEHHGHHPEIDLTSDTTATGSWYLQDRVIVPVGRSRDRGDRVLLRPLRQDG